jgi:hypothetical protein
MRKRERFSAQPLVGDVNSLLNSSWDEGSFFTPISYYREFILAATNDTTVFVPEPSTTALLVLGVLDWLSLAKR